MPNSNNRRRIFADVVNIDAWHEPFGTVARVDLHADVVFDDARLGGEAESPIRFRLSAKKAEVLIVVPDTEPLAIDKKSVSRDTHQVRVSNEETIKRKRSVTGKAGLRGAIGLEKTAVGVDAAVGAEGEMSSERKTEVTSESGQIRVMQSKTADGYYRWTLEPADGASLIGRPWDANQSPRLKLIDLRKNKSKHIAPCVRVEVRCKREDLVIHDIIVKDETLWQAVQRRFGHRNQMAAAESYIRNSLANEGLEVGNFDDLYGDLTLASATPEPTQSS